MNRSCKSFDYPDKPQWYRQDDYLAVFDQMIPKEQSIQSWLSWIEVEKTVDPTGERRFEREDASDLFVRHAMKSLPKNSQFYQCELCLSQSTMNLEVILHSLYSSQCSLRTNNDNK